MQVCKQVHDFEEIPSLGHIAPSFSSHTIALASCCSSRQRFWPERGIVVLASAPIDHSEAGSNGLLQAAVVSLTLATRRGYDRSSWYLVGCHAVVPSCTLHLRLFSLPHEQAILIRGSALSDSWFSSALCFLFLHGWDKNHKGFQQFYTSMTILDLASSGFHYVHPFIPDMLHLKPCLAGIGG